MSARPTPVVLAEDGARLAPLSRIADLLHVARSTMHAWVAAREINGFPLPARTGHIVGHGAGDLYDIDAVRAWRLFDHDPNLRGVQRKHRATDPDRGGPAAIGRMLGVSTKRVCGWIERRDQTGCPQKGEDGRYSFDEWQAWHDAWVQRPGVTAAHGRTRAA